MTSRYVNTERMTSAGVSVTRFASRSRQLPFASASDGAGPVRYNRVTSVCLSACWDARPPPEQTPPGADTPGSRHPPDQAPPQTMTGTQRLKGQSRDICNLLLQIKIGIFPKF